MCVKQAIFLSASLGAPPWPARAEGICALCYQRPGGDVCLREVI